MIRVLYRIIGAAVTYGGFAVLGLVLLGLLPLPLLFWLASETGRALWAFWNLPPVVQGIGVGILVYAALAKYFHNQPLKAQREKAIQRAQGDYDAQKW